MIGSQDFLNRMVALAAGGDQADQVRLTRRMGAMSVDGTTTFFARSSSKLETHTEVSLAPVYFPSPSQAEISDQSTSPSTSFARCARHTRRFATAMVACGKLEVRL